ncbi:MAG: NAD(P)H-dependent oxidoreductase [Planctomycetes bacterium]|nr:NAD(P)H-dependent oxidoreductase [Planctomycetota bacterium]
MHIVVVPGTNRAGSLSSMLAKLALADYAALGHSTDLLELALGPEFLEPEAYKKPKPAVTALVDRFLAADGVVFVVPEYNGSYPGVLKLFIDMLPYPQGFDRRPCAFIGLSAGGFQALRAVEHLQGVAGYRNAFVYPNRVFIGESHKQFDAANRLVDARLAERVRNQAVGFVQFIAALKTR